jgi:hypothetical protein
MTGSGSERIRVVGRVRPGENGPVSVDATSITVRTPAGAKMFGFDGVLGPHSTQSQVFSLVGEDAVNHVVAGYNATVLCYGQTGSGKTHTMIGPEGGVVAQSSGPTSGEGAVGDPLAGPHRGLVPRVAEALFGAISGLEGPEASFTVSVSFVELYMEKFRDLLDSDKNKVVRVRDDPVRGRKGAYLEGVREEQVASPGEVLTVLRRGLRTRHTAETASNATSSRSHAILSITVEQVDRVHSGARTRATLNLVDLAGSEKVSKSLAEGQRLKEAAKINLSLTLLGNVINKLSEGGGARGRHIPYRDSQLTRFLENSLGGNSKTCLLCCASPASSNLPETLSTLLFAGRAKRIALEPRVNKEMTLAELQAALARANEHIRILQLQLQAAGIMPQEPEPSSSSSSTPSTVPGSASGRPPRAPLGGASPSASSESLSLLQGGGAEDGSGNVARELADLQRQLRDLQDEASERIEAVSRLTQERDYYKSQQGDQSAKLSALYKKWKDEEKVARYWARKFQELQAGGGGGGRGGGGGGGGRVSSSSAASSSAKRVGSSSSALTSRSSAADLASSKAKTKKSGDTTARKRGGAAGGGAKKKSGAATGGKKKVSSKKKEDEDLLKEYKRDYPTLPVAHLKRAIALQVLPTDIKYDSAMRLTERFAAPAALTSELTSSEEEEEEEEEEDEEEGDGDGGEAQSDSFEQPSDEDEAGGGGGGGGGGGSSSGDGEVAALLQERLDAQSRELAEARRMLERMANAGTRAGLGPDKLRFTLVHGGEDDGGDDDDGYAGGDGAVRGGPPSSRPRAPSDGTSHELEELRRIVAGKKGAGGAEERAEMAQLGKLRATLQQRTEQLGELEQEVPHLADYRRFTQEKRDKMTAVVRAKVDKARKDLEAVRDTLQAKLLILKTDKAKEEHQSLMALYQDGWDMLEGISIQVF